MSVGLAGWLAGKLAEMMARVGGGVAWPVISVMICTDVSCRGSGTRPTEPEALRLLNVSLTSARARPQPERLWTQTLLSLADVVITPQSHHAL